MRILSRMMICRFERDGRGLHERLCRNPDRHWRHRGIIPSKPSRWLYKSPEAWLGEVQTGNAQEGVALSAVICRHCCCWRAAVPRWRWRFSKYRPTSQPSIFDAAVRWANRLRESTLTIIRHNVWFFNGSGRKNTEVYNLTQSFTSTALCTSFAFTDAAPFTWGASFSAVRPMPLPPEVAKAKTRLPSHG